MSMVKLLMQVWWVWVEEQQQVKLDANVVATTTTIIAIQHTTKNDLTIEGVAFKMKGYWRAY